VIANLIPPPSSQKAGQRPISFVLRGGGDYVVVNLVIRPEQLTKTSPSRLSVHQTLGGAWADNFGPGISRIQISGHTGWRRVVGNDDDGVDRFTRLKTAVFDKWHARRQLQTTRGLNPDDVQLILVDTLNRAVTVVAPFAFSLLRSRMQPLLYKYQIDLTELKQHPGSMPHVPVQDEPAPEAVRVSMIDSLTESINRITEFIEAVRVGIDRVLVAPVQEFMRQTARLYSAMRTAIREMTAVAESLIQVAQLAARAGLNLFRTLAAVAGLPSMVRQRLMAVAGAYSNVLCLLYSEMIRWPRFFQDFTPMMGASNCSSVGGGRPITRFVDSSPLAALFPDVDSPPVMVARSAQEGLTRLANNDPVQHPLSTPEIERAVVPVAAPGAIAFPIAPVPEIVGTPIPLR